MQYVLEGSTRREGRRLRIGVTLIRASDQTQVWSDAFDRELTSVLTLQHDVARGVAGALALRLRPAAGSVGETTSGEPRGLRGLPARVESC